MAELKPCPFCGAEAEIIDEREMCGHGESVLVVYIECENCDARGPSYCHWDDGRKEWLISRAIKSWNMRMDGDGNG